MHVERQPLDQRLRQETRPETPRRRSAARSRSPAGSSRRRSRRPELGQPDRDRDDRVGRDHGGAFEPGRHQQREQDDAGADGAARDGPSRTPPPRAAVRQREPRRCISRRSGTLRIIMPPITSIAPLPVSMRVSPGAERAVGTAATSTISACASRPDGGSRARLVLVNSAESEMIGTTGSGRRSAPARAASARRCHSPRHRRSARRGARCRRSAQAAQARYRRTRRSTAAGLAIGRERDALRHVSRRSDSRRMVNLIRSPGSSRHAFQFRSCRPPWGSGGRIPAPSPAPPRAATRRSRGGTRRARPRPRQRLRGTFGDFGRSAVAVGHGTPRRHSSLAAQRSGDRSPLRTVLGTALTLPWRGRSTPSEARRRGGVNCLPKGSRTPLPWSRPSPSRGGWAPRPLRDRTSIYLDAFNPYGMRR